MRPVSFLEARGLLLYLYEREYGAPNRAAGRREEAERDASAAHLAANYQRGLRRIPLDPDFVPPTVSTEPE